MATNTNMELYIALKAPRLVLGLYISQKNICEMGLPTSHREKNAEVRGARRDQYGDPNNRHGTDNTPRWTNTRYEIFF